MDVVRYIVTVAFTTACMYPLVKLLQWPKLEHTGL